MEALQISGYLIDDRPAMIDDGQEAMSELYLVISWLNFGRALSSGSLTAAGVTACCHIYDDSENERLIFVKYVHVI